jgi:DNA-binding NarL/FixJ family response regulator
MDAVSTEDRPRPGDSIALLIVDQHIVMRAGVRTLLDSEDGVQVVAEADNVDEAVGMIRAASVDVVLMDVDETSLQTIDEIRRLRRESPSGTGAIVVLDGRDDDDNVFRAVIGGAAGHVANSAQPAELVDTIRRAATGEEPIRDTLRQRPDLGRRVLETFARLSMRDPARPEPHLSQRELNILSFAAQGMTNNQIGREMGVSEHTIKAALSRLLTRLGMRHRTEAVVHAISHGWIQSPATVAVQVVEAEPPLVDQQLS